MLGGETDFDKRWSHEKRRWEEDKGTASHLTIRSSGDTALLLGDIRTGHPGRHGKRSGLDAGSGAEDMGDGREVCCTVNVCVNI